MRVMVTGAAGALGRVTCLVLAEHGHEVLGVDRAEAGIPDHDRVRPYYGADLTDAAQVTALVQSMTSDGPVAGLVNIAGGFAWETVLEGDPATWEKMWTLNVMTALHACRALAPLLPDGEGSIVNIGAAAAVKATAGMGAYTATKSGVARLTEALAEELKPRGVRVNALLPSIIDTPANRKDMPDADFSAWVTPRELAETAAFLLSGKASGVTGALLPVVGRV